MGADEARPGAMARRGGRAPRRRTAARPRGSAVRAPGAGAGGHAPVQPPPCARAAAGHSPRAGGLPTASV